MADSDQDIFGENKASTSPEETEDKLFGEENTTEISLDDDDKAENPPSLPESSPVVEPSAPPAPTKSSTVMLDDEDESEQPTPTPTVTPTSKSNGKSQVDSYV